MIVRVVAWLERSAGQDLASPYSSRILSRFIWATSLPSPYSLPHGRGSETHNPLLSARSHSLRWPCHQGRVWHLGTGAGVGRVMKRGEGRWYKFARPD